MAAATEYCGQLIEFPLSAQILIIQHVQKSADQGFCFIPVEAVFTIRPWRRAAVDNDIGRGNG